MFSELFERIEKIIEKIIAKIISIQEVQNLPLQNSPTQNYNYQEDDENASVGHLAIILTHRCNLDCRYCLRGATSQEKEEIDFSILEKIVLSAHRAGCRRCGITGGEALLYSKLKELINLFGVLGWHVWLETNGKILTPDWCGYLKEKLRDNFLIFTSLDSNKKDIHDALRGEGNFDSVIKAIKLIKSYNIWLVTNSVITPINYIREKELLDFISFNKNLGVNQVHLNRVVGLGRGKQRELWLSPHKVLEIYNILRKYNFFDGYVGGAFGFKEGDCPRIRREICVSSAGIHPCIFQEGIKIGELENFKNIIWKREFFESMFSLQADISKNYQEKGWPFSCVECVREFKKSLVGLKGIKLL